MSSNTVFVSHIHEEKELAVLFKNATESEFSGFVDVFVSSDGTSIPSGVNFLEYIENSLLACKAAIYLISPLSLSRNWINFELGAVWVRNLLSTKAGGPSIPTIPICHSNIKRNQLPSPLGNLNAINATDEQQIHQMLSSIQRAVGGKGSLKTDISRLEAV